MMIDFALEAQRTGKQSPRDAIFQACLLRLRPILMTTMAALLGAVPLHSVLALERNCASRWEFASLRSAG